MSERKRCRWFHRWRSTGDYDGLFSLISKCEKCGLYRQENLLTEETKYGYPKETS